MKAPKLPTDLQILQAIFDRYCSIYLRYEQDSSIRATKVYVPIDVDAIAEDLSSEGDIIFARLYHHLDRKYREKQEGVVNHSLFARILNDERHCVHFPFLTSILAELKQERRRYIWTLRLSIASFILSIVSLALRF